MLILGSAFAVSACEGLLGSDRPPGGDPEVALLAVVLDVSDSSSVPPTTRCLQLRQDVDVTLREYEQKPATLELVVFATGDRASSYAPRTLVPWRQMERPPEAFASSERRARQRAKLLDEMQAACDTRAVATRESPILASIEAVRSSLVAQTEDHERRGRRVVLQATHVMSDMRESLDAELVASIRTLGLGRNKGKAAIATVPPIVRQTSAHTRVEIAVCGVADTQGEPDSRSRALDPMGLRDAWAARLGPDTPLAFNATCAMPALAAATSNPEQPQ